LIKRPILKFLLSRVRYFFSHMILLLYFFWQSTVFIMRLPQAEAKIWSFQGDSDPLCCIFIDLAGTSIHPFIVGVGLEGCFGAWSLLAAVWDISNGWVGLKAILAKASHPACIHYASMLILGCLYWLRLSRLCLPLMGNQWNYSRCFCGVLYTLGVGVFFVIDSRLRYGPFGFGIYFCLWVGTVSPYFSIFYLRRLM